MSGLKPALTAEEWVSPSCNNGIEVYLRDDGGDLVQVFRSTEIDALCVTPDKGGRFVLPPDEVHTLAAVCLHGQPFGFTQYDIEVIAWMVDMVDILGVALNQDEHKSARRCAIIRSIADRIEALLPPGES